MRERVNRRAAVDQGRHRDKFVGRVHRGADRVFGKRDLDLGKPLAPDFARQFLLGDFDDVRQFFSRKLEVIGPD